MNPLAKIVSYLVFILLLATLLSPPIYWLAQWAGGHGVLPFLAEFPFRRFFSRTVEVTAIVFLIPLLFWLHIRSISEFGLVKNSHRVRDLTAGVLIALIPLVVMSACYLHFEVYRIKDEYSLFPFFRILGTAAVVAFIEEWLFRGVLLGLTAKAFGRWPAALGVSAVFAIVHFLKPAAPDEVVRWTAGFEQISKIFAGGPPLPLLVLGFVSLFVAGLILALATFRTRSLWLPIGIHAGWIVGQQTFQLFAKYKGDPDSKLLPSDEELLPWVGPNVVSGAVPTGLVAIFVLLLTGAAVWFYLRNVTASPYLRSSGLNS